ncbi:DUF397 domain-containing protein [Streptomyces griseorubiginosus]|uniref:DUF397 domain-containing protein n=1 Tax=Streptomyces griseorubiginosus TaxID=67304 RepID=A0AAI8L1E0_9ACTN|nr:DUF397 domain-containing protein [Streptomyces griseorubiginosus]AYC39706.1 hypothetical protein DWG14_03948 [Streptomyces griseorubiginosus]KUM75801.1 toxin-antitoxin system, toxin component [Streptomyces griseorubiginosus]
MNWRKSTYSGGGEGNTCVEIAEAGPRIAVRDSKAPARATLTFPAPAFTALIDHLKEHPWSEARTSG